MQAKKGFFSKLFGGFSKEPAPMVDGSVSSTTVSPEAKKTAKLKTPKAKDLSSWLLLCEDGDGHNREKAVKSLGQLGDPEAIPSLIIRVNDWVPQVAACAQKALHDLATPENASTFVLTLPDLNHLKKCKRHDHHPFITTIEEYLVAEDNVNEVIQGLQDSDHRVAQACFALVTKHQLLEPVEFVITGLRSNDISTRIKASHFLKDLEGEAQAAALKVAIKDKCMTVRREAFLIMLTQWGNDTLAKEFLFDKKSAMREIAIMHIRSLGLDVQYTYLRSLSDDDVHILCCALWGLGYLDSKDCVAQIEPFKDHPSEAVRNQAIRTLERLANVNHRKFHPEWNSIDTYI